MPEALPPELIALRERTRALLGALEPLERALEAGEDEETVRATIVELSRREGFFGMTHPKALGGAALGPLGLTVVREALAAANLRAARHVLGPRPGVLGAAAGRLREAYLEPLLRGEKRAAFAFTEPEGAARRTWAVQAGDSLVVTGRKAFVSAGASADFLSVVLDVEPGAAGPGGPAVVVVDTTAPGVAIERVFQTLDGGSHAVFRFQSVRVPRWRVVGRIGEGMPRALENISALRLALAAQACGIMQWAVGSLTERLRAPRRDGASLGDREGVRLRYADMRMEVFAARSVLYRAARIAESGANDVNEVMCAKVFCTEAAGRVIDAAVQLSGGPALTVGHPLERLYREVRAMRFAEGASDVLRLNIARGRLDLDRGTL